MGPSFFILLHVIVPTLCEDQQSFHPYSIWKYMARFEKETALNISRNIEVNAEDRDVPLGTNKHCMIRVIKSGLNQLMNTAQVYISNQTHTSSNESNFTYQYVTHRHAWLQCVDNLTRDINLSDKPPLQHSDKDSLWDSGETSELFELLQPFFEQFSNTDYVTCFPQLNSNNNDIPVDDKNVIFQTVKELMKFSARNNFSCIIDTPWAKEFLSVELWNSIILEESRLRIVQVFRTYVTPAVFSVLILVGFIWNGVLLIMFSRHKEIRTSANMMILNLAICDLLNLIVAGPMVALFSFSYPHGMPENVAFCRFYSVIRHWVACATAMSVVALSIQRFCITLPTFKFRIPTLIMTILTHNLIYILLIWMVSLILALPFAVTWEVYSYLCSCSENKYPSRLYLFFLTLVFVVFLPTLMFLFSFLTAYRLRRSIKIASQMNCQAQHVCVRKRSANVVTSLAVLFVVSNFPFWIWVFFAYWLEIERTNAVIVYSEYVTKYLLLLNSVFNPVALFIVSRTYRKLFMRYLCCWTKSESKPERQNTTSSTIQHSSDL